MSESYYPSHLEIYWQGRPTWSLQKECSGGILLHEGVRAEAAFMKYQGEGKRTVSAYPLIRLFAYPLSPKSSLKHP